MKRALFLVAIGCAVGSPAIVRAAAGEAAYDLTTPTGVLGGTLLLPPAVTRPPAVLIVAGSGPVDRNGNAGAYQSNAYRMLAEALAARGIASVRYDKRGVGESASALHDVSNIRFDGFVDDAAGWIAKMRADKRFSKIALAGHSEGSLIGIIAGRRAPLDAFVSLEGAGRPGAVLLHEQFAARLKSYPKLLASANRITDSLAAGKIVKDVPAELASALAPVIQPYIISWMSLDPSAEIAKLQTAVTIVQGTADIQTSVVDARALAAAKPSAKLDIVDGMMHMLKHVGSMSADDQVKSAYTDPNLPLDPAVAGAIASALA